MRFHETTIGQRVVQIEGMDNEVRHTYYERAEGEVYDGRYLGCYRLRMWQGLPGEQPRYDSGPIRIFSHLHRLALVENCTDAKTATTLEG